MHALSILSILATVCWTGLLANAGAQEPVGKRPYEMEWAGRTADTRPPLIDFEDIGDWQTVCQEAEAEFSSSREQQLWGRRVGKLVYRGDGNQPKITVRPPKSVPLPKQFDSINFWVYGNNWGWSPDPTTPPVEVRVLLSSAGGGEMAISMGQVRWKEWWLMHRRLTAAQQTQLGRAASFTGLEIVRGTNPQDRLLFFDNLTIYQEPLPSLTLDPRPKRGISLPPGQTAGLNQGPGQLPFPNRDQTILPDNVADDFQTSLDATDQGYQFRYRGPDGELIYRYRPETGTLSDVGAEWIGRGTPFRPLDQGGIRFWPDTDTDTDTSLSPETIELIKCERQGDAIVSTWDCRLGSRRTEVTYRLQLWQKSLVIDVHSRSDQVGEFHVGQVVGSDNPRLITVPFLTGADQRPAILVSGPTATPLFVSSFVDHCRSNSSELWFANRITQAHGTGPIAVQNGGSRYLPKTDGVRNPCFERVFLTVSPRFQETLPNIPNPPSPWKHVTGQRVWRAHGASNRERDFAHWEKVARYGMTKVAITDHETGWRDGGESFTLRTRAAPGKGGDAGQAEYARKIRALGFRYGIYNNYTDFAPVNEFWDEDDVSRLPDGQWRTAWPRCYNLKPSRAVELESRLAPIIQEKFHLDTAYCDVHTAVRPWSYCDFDARVPGAGTFAATFYAYGEIMLHQKETWQGPVYSEGNNHWYYCGLTDGNYGQDQVAQLATSPWLVDFDLRKMHPLCCNFGMGNPGMFFGRNRGLGTTAAERQARLDRFLAATLAFGHTGFLVFEGGFQNAVQSYFSVQQVQARYAEQQVSRIQYADSTGQLLTTSQAVASGAYRRSQVATRYEDGLQVIVNGHPTDTWKIDDTVLPPNGWIVRDEGRECLTAYSKLVDGHRVDYVDAPAYLYANGRGQLTRFEKATCDGQLIVHRRENAQVELIPLDDCSVFGISLDGMSATAIALDTAGEVLGPAPVRYSRQRVYVTPVSDAFSYLLTPIAPPAETATCDRVTAIPGETVQIGGAAETTVHIPATAQVGEQIWHQSGQAWIDFSVRPLATVSLESVAPLQFNITSHLAAETDAQLDVRGHRVRETLVPEHPLTIILPNTPLQHESVQRIPLKILADGLTHEQSWWVKTEMAIRKLAVLESKPEAGQCLRQQDETELDSRSGAQVYRTSRACGGDAQDCLFMHPPYRTGVGYAYALFEPVDLPQESSAAFRCLIGKADGSDPGDGLLFRIMVIDSRGEGTVVAERSWGQHAWTPIEADLSRWAGQSVQIKLVTDAGPADNSAGDWGCWANLRIEDRDPVLTSSIHSQPVTLTREPGPTDRGNLSIQQIRSARRAVLHLQGIGLQADRHYATSVQLNSVPVGQLPAAGGDEQNNSWEDARLPLPAAVTESLREWNSLQVKNPTRDSFKVRRFWIELELADGESAASHVTTTTFTQPPTWDFSEGVGVPFGEHIQTHIRFPIKRDERRQGTLP